MNFSRKIHLIAGARPNFMKVAPLYHAITRDGSMVPYIVHTGQHYGSMSDSFLEQLGIRPDFFLDVGSGTHAEQTGQVMIAYEKICNSKRPACVIVVGDVNSTVACALAAKKLGVMVAHLEAGLRSYDRSMPEEINRLATDAISDILWAPSMDAVENLRREGVPEDRIDFVGNIMMDSYELLRESIERVPVRTGEYGVVTLHRPSNVDNSARLTRILETLDKVSVPLYFPVHPRTRNKMRVAPSYCEDPMDYIQFMSLVSHAKFVITDSGGLQEETTYLGIPCFTLRENTERPITISEGTNRLVTLESLVGEVERVASIVRPTLKYWDGQTAQRVVESLNRRI